jgi:hypothetical protein
MTDPVYVTRIKPPLALRTMLSVLVSIAILLISFFRSPGNTIRPHDTLYYVLILCLIFSSLLEVYLILLALRKATEMKWSTDTLQIHNRIILAPEIKSIHIDGPLVGILPKNTRIVPLSLCFRFTDDRTQAIESLHAWAEMNGVRLKYGRFVKWM